VNYSALSASGQNPLNECDPLFTRRAAKPRGSDHHRMTPASRQGTPNPIAPEKSCRAAKSLGYPLPTRRQGEQRARFCSTAPSPHSGSAKRVRR
jgi:hypothetical protein